MLRLLELDSKALVSATEFRKVSEFESRSGHYYIRVVVSKRIFRSDLRRVLARIGRY